MKKTVLLIIGTLSFAFAYGQVTTNNQPQLAASSSVENVKSDSITSKTPVPNVGESIDPATIPASSGKSKDEKSPVLSEGDPKK